MQGTKRFTVDHLKSFFENEMNARQVNDNYTITNLIKQFCAELSEEEIDEPFYMLNLSYFARQYLRWNHYLPRIHPFYAVKSNPNKFIIRVLNELGAGFDCASAEELDTVRNQCGNNFDCLSRVIYAHPCKPISHIRRFRNAGVRMTVVDNIDELKKLSLYWPDAKVLIRLKPDDTHSSNPLSSKFGASEEECIDILRLGRELNVDLVGCTFHVGSRCYDVQIFVQSIQIARRIFDVACSDRFQFQFNLLDIGGGFMGHHSEEPTLPKVAAVINKTLNILFPENEGVRVISEPGRYFSSGGMTLVCRIIGRRIITESERNDKIKSSSQFLSQCSENESDDGVCDTEPLPVLVPLSAMARQEFTFLTVANLIQRHEKKNLYYINDGIYGTFNAILFDQKTFLIHYLRMSSLTEQITNKRTEEKEEYFKSVIFGPTCDSIDCVANSVNLPLLDINDILWFPDVGSYTSGSASNFNGFKTNKYVLFWYK